MVALITTRSVTNIIMKKSKESTYWYSVSFKKQDTIKYYRTSNYL